MIKKIANTEIRKHTIGMFVIGGVVWLLYLGYANLLTMVFGVNHIVAEITGIPLSWIINYALNTKYNFAMPFSVRRFVSFCSVSTVGWVIYLITTIILTDALGVASWVGTLAGVITKTVYNVILQQAITFGKYGDKDKKMAKSARPDYDWNGYYKGNFIQKRWKGKIINITLSMIESNPIVDIGCGSSPLLSLIKRGKKVGLDANPEKVAFLSDKDNTSTYVCGDGTHTMFNDGEFCTTICNEVIEHHVRPNELVRELARITKTNGVVIIATPDYSSIIWNIIEVLYGLIMNVGYELEHGSKFTKTGIVAVANAYGLELEDYKVIAKADMVLKFRKV